MTVKSEDDYQFPDDEYVGDMDELASEEEKASASAQDSSDSDEELKSPLQKVLGTVKSLWNRNPRVGIVLVVVIILIIVFGLMSDEGVKKPNVVVPESQTPVKPMDISQPIRPLDIQPVQPVQSVVTTSQIRSLKEQVTTQQASVNQVASQVSQLNQTLDSLSKMQATMQTAISDLGEQTAKIADDLKKQKVKKQVKPIEKLYFYVRALLPGRAWIYSTSGRQTSVRVGDRIPQYGIVKAIDPEQGIVLTSSGKTIQFSPEDM